jgi:putative FmdB family regulatory protein
MPTYVYKCPDCEVEERRKMSQADDPLDCPLCGELLVRGITTFMFNSGRSAPPTKPTAPPASQHGSGCPCCYPVRRSNR